LLGKLNLKLSLANMRWVQNTFWNGPFKIDDDVDLVKSITLQMVLVSSSRTMWPNKDLDVVCEWWYFQK